MRILILLLFTIPCLVSAQLQVGKSLPEVELSGKKGGLVEGGSWRSTEMKGKVTTLMYVDPDEKEVNEHVEQALKKQNFPRDRYGSVAVVNTAATWKPDNIIRMVLKGKQKDFRDTRYVMDRDKALVKQWKLADDNYHVLTFDKEGKLIFQKAGKLNDVDIQHLIQKIREKL